MFGSTVMLIAFITIVIIQFSKMAYKYTNQQEASITIVKINVSSQCSSAMECIASNKQERHRRKLALQLNVHRIRQGMRAAEQLRFGRQRGCYVTQRHSSPVESQPSPPATSDETNHESSNGTSDLLNTARIESDLEDGDNQASIIIVTKSSAQRGPSMCCRCAKDGRKHERRIRRRLFDAQTVILEDRMVSQVISSRMTWYYLYATMLLEFWNLEKHVEGTGRKADGFVRRALKSMFNARRRAQEMESKFRKKSKSKTKDSSDSASKKKD